MGATKRLSLFHAIYTYVGKIENVKDSMRGCLSVLDEGLASRSREFAPIERATLELET